jgi:excisionase family DNA binding protein
VKSVVIDQENPEGLDDALRVFAELLVRRYMAEKKRMEAPPASPVRGEPDNDSGAGRRLLDVKGLSNYLSLPIATIYSWVSLRRIPERAVIRLGRSLRFDLQEIDAWVEQQKR